MYWKTQIKILGSRKLDVFIRECAFIFVIITLYCSANFFRVSLLKILKPGIIKFLLKIFLWLLFKKCPKIKKQIKATTITALCSFLTFFIFFQTHNYIPLKCASHIWDVANKAKCLLLVSFSAQGS